jgi:peptidoglycan hydrolase CwlO-like protein
MEKIMSRRDDDTWRAKYISPILIPLIVAFIIGAINYYSIANVSREKMNAMTLKLSTNCKDISKEIERNNQQDATLTQLKEKVSNQRVALDRIEASIDKLSDYQQSMTKEMLGEIRNISQEIGTIKTFVAVMKDREDRDLQNKSDKGVTWP